MRLRFTTALAAVLCLAPVASQAQLSAYSQDFESLNMADPAALTNDGWLIFGNVFNSGGGYVYGYGVFGAPNGGNGFSAIATGEGGPSQGLQQLSIYGDYNNGDQDAAGLNFTVEANTFQEQQNISAGDVGNTYVFTYDAKIGNWASPSGAIAFIKTLDPNAGFATTNFLINDSSTLPTTWGTYSISITIDSSLIGQILQFGFAATTNNYGASGVFYDNISFGPGGPVSVEDSSWGSVKSLYR